KLKKRRRGQIRAVDFIVSLFLFLLMLTQIIIIIINIQSDITNTGIEDISYEELDIFGRQLLEQEGDLNWGYYKNLPASFGLADSKSSFPLKISAAKIARLITGTTFPISGVTGYEMFGYSSLREIINLDLKFDFQIGFSPFLKVNVISYQILGSDPPRARAEVIVTNHQNVPISNAHVYFYTVDLTNGNSILEGVFSTNSTGGTSNDYLIPNIDNPNNEHINLVIVKKATLWGMNWGYFKSGLPTARVSIGPDADTTIWGGGINSSSILVSDILEVTETPDNHFLSIIYENTSSEFSTQLLDLGTSYDSNETIAIPDMGLTFFISIVRTDSSYEVGIGSYPAILDRNSDTGMFYYVFGKTNPGTNVKAMLSKTYPIVVRGTLMQCQLILWRK
ncbi:MAG: hypothetical protein ACW964_08940, partial [Candidatus Hodarchaeales archaeon]